jgi:hypothetical protein
MKKIWYNACEITIKDEDIEFYETLEEKEHSKIISESKIKRFTFWKVVATVVLFCFWVIPGILNILYIFSKKHARNMAIKKATKDFYLEKIDSIPFYSSVQGITVLENLGSINEKGEIAAKIKAYNNKANAIINVGHRTVVHTQIKSDMIGKGIHTKIKENEYITGDLAVIEHKKS